jgi:CspA family cold shock protein
MRTTGRVRWFDAARGYGFIDPEGDNTSTFVHFSAIRMDGYKSLETGQRVEYDLVQREKGPAAANVTVIP